MTNVTPRTRLSFGPWWGKCLEALQQSRNRLNGNQPRTTFLLENKTSLHRTYDSARFIETLEPKTTLLIHLATAMAIGCEP